MEVGGVALAVPGLVQDGMNVVEDVPLGDGRVVVVSAEFFERAVSDVLAGGGARATYSLTHRLNSRSLHYACPSWSEGQAPVEMTISRRSQLPGTTSRRWQLSGDGNFREMTTPRS